MPTIISVRRALAAAALALPALLGLLAPATASAAPEAFLEPDEAFRVTATAEGERVRVRLAPAPGYYLYRQRIAVASADAAAAVQPAPLPPGEPKFDPNFNQTVEVYHQPVEVDVRVQATSPLELAVDYQGCADRGLCYAPMRQAFAVEPTAGGGLAVRALEATTAFGVSPTLTTAAPASSAATPMAAAPSAGGIGAALASRSLLQVAGTFLLAGLLLAFTPCVLPMVPILSSIIVGQGVTTRARGLSLAGAYVLGMALVYTALGMAAGLAGEGLAAWLQNPWVLGAFALLMVALALSMFGVYQLQLPGQWQAQLSQASGRFSGGRHAGVFAMGGLSALIVGPCVAAPLAGALLYISQTRDVLLGGTALFAMALGMGVPLLLVGASAGALLPRAGAWMERVKHVFGGLMLAMALWIVQPVLPGWALMLGVAALLSATAVYLGAFERGEAGAAGPGRAALRGFGLLLALGATVQVVGAASGGRDVLQPLAHLRPVEAGVGGAASPARASAELTMRRVATTAELDAAVRSADRPVMIDFYADWCVACKELEAFTFADPEVRARLDRMTLLRVDVTANSPADRELMRRYRLFGPPALVFHEPSGAEQAEARVIGFIGAQDFATHVDRHLGHKVAPAPGGSVPGRTASTGS